MKFTQGLIKVAEPYLQRIFDHPFIMGMVKGDLSRHIFDFYLQQDAYYLQQFSGAIALLAMKCQPKHREIILGFSSGAVAAEQAMIAKQYVCVVPTDFALTPACDAYVRFLL